MGGGDPDAITDTVPITFDKNTPRLQKHPAPIHTHGGPGPAPRLRGGGGESHVIHGIMLLEVILGYSLGEQQAPLILKYSIY